MGHLSSDKKDQPTAKRRSAQTRAKLGRVANAYANVSKPELTGDPATDQALLELAEVLAEIARTLPPSSSREVKEDDRPET